MFPSYRDIRSAILRWNIYIGKAGVAFRRWPRCLPRAREARIVLCKMNEIVDFHNTDSK
jgi:hypothetical protein